MSQHNAVSIWCCPRQFRLCCHVSLIDKIMSNRIEIERDAKKRREHLANFYDVRMLCSKIYIPKDADPLIPRNHPVTQAGVTVLPPCQASTFGDSPGAWELQTKSCHENHCHFPFFFATSWVKKETLTNIVDDRIIFLWGDYGWINAMHFSRRQCLHFLLEKTFLSLRGVGFHRQWWSTLRKVGSTWPSSLLGVGTSNGFGQPNRQRAGRNFNTLWNGFGSFS